MNFNRLVSEWAWRVNDGCPDPKNRTHVEFLRDVLRENGYDEDWVLEYTENLIENKKLPFQAFSLKAQKIVGFATRDARKQAIKNGTHIDLDKLKKRDDFKRGGKDKKGSSISFDRTAAGRDNLANVDADQLQDKQKQKAATIKQIMSFEGPLPADLRIQKKEILDELKQDSKEDSKIGKELREALDSIKTLDSTDRENRELLIALGQTYTERDNAGWSKNSFGIADRDQLLKNRENLIELYGDGSPEHVAKGVRSIRKTKVSETEVKEMYDTLPKKLQKYLAGAGAGGKNVGDNHFLGYKKNDDTITSDRNDPDLQVDENGNPVAARGKVPNKARAMMVLRVYKEQGGMCAYRGLPLDLESMDLEHVVGLNNKDRGNPKDHLLDRENDNNFVITSSAANQKKLDMNMKDFYEKQVDPLKNKSKEDFDKMEKAKEDVSTMKPRTEQTAMRLMDNPKLRKEGGGTITLEEYEAMSEDERPKLRTTDFGTPKIADADLDASVTAESLQREFDYEDEQYRETRNTLLENVTDESDIKTVKRLQTKIGKKVMQAMGLACNLDNEGGRNSGDAGSDTLYKSYGILIASADSEGRKKLKEIWAAARKFANSRDDKGNLVNGKLNDKNQKAEFKKFILEQIKEAGIDSKALQDDRYKKQWGIK